MGTPLPTTPCTRAAIPGLLYLHHLLLLHRGSISLLLGLLGLLLRGRLLH